MRRIFRIRPTLLGAVLAGAALAASSPGAAANLLLNGSFDSGLAGWTQTPSARWASDGSSGPGSVRVGDTGGIVGKLVLSQCVAVSAGADLDLGASVRLPYSPEAAGGVSLRVVWYPEPACGGEALGLTPALDFPDAPGDGWIRRGLERLRVPGDALSASVEIVPWSSGPPTAFSAYVDDVALEPSPRFVTLTLPTAASVDGARGERFRTTLVVKNPALVDRRLDATLRCRATEPCLSATVSLVLLPRETRVFADVLADLFGLRSGAGAIDLTYDATLGPIVASARAATVHAARPGNGMTLPVLPASAARRTATFSGLSDGRGGIGGTRVNAGVYNPLEESVTVGFEVRSASRPSGSTVYVMLAPREWAQVNDLFAVAGAGAADPGSFVTFVSEAPVFPFLISIDNRSGDPTLLEPREGSLR